ncbi:MAG: hypothetical protein ACOH2A_02505 [Sphingobacteriaceae bacterium]
MKEQIKVGFLISYDYEMLKVSLPLIYASADWITLAIDCNNKTWSGLDLHIPDAFYDWVKLVDTDQKISIYKDDFYQASLSVMENDTRERNMLSKFMEPGGWHIQIDTDEYFVEFEQFVHFLRNQVDKLLNFSNEPVTLYVKWVSLFKEVEGGYLSVTSFEDVPIATRHPIYKQSRLNDHRKIFANFIMMHQSWARTRHEIQVKLSSWSHKDDFNTDSYFNLWDVCDQHNYVYYNNFHPLVPEIWASLRFIVVGSIAELIENYSKKDVTILKDHLHKESMSTLDNRSKRNAWRKFLESIAGLWKR